MMQIPRGSPDLICPFHRKAMSKVCHVCPMWTQVRGSDPNSGEDVNRWNCSLAWMPMMLIENAQQQRQTGAAMESFRNEMVKASNARLGMMSNAINGIRNIGKT